MYGRTFLDPVRKFTILAFERNASVMPAVYLQIPDIEGTVKTPGFEGWIELESYSFAGPVPVQTGGGGGNTPLKSIDSVGITKRIDKASPRFYKTSGIVWPEVVLYAEGHSAGALVYVMSGVVLTGISMAAAGRNPLESITLNFTGLKLMSAGEYWISKKIQSVVRRVTGWF
jgi:type VI protein secretion system component Hcp